MWKGERSDVRGHFTLVPIQGITCDVPCWLCYHLQWQMLALMTSVYVQAQVLFQIGNVKKVEAVRYTMELVMVSVGK